MNLSVKRIALLFYVASAILITSCDETKEIGLPQGQSLGVSVTDVPINTSTVLVDSVLTSGASYLLAGRYNDSKLGEITATGYAQLIYGGDEFTAENPTRADSAVLFLPYTYYNGDTTRQYKVAVHLLQDTIQARRYYNFDQLPYQPDAIAEATFQPKPNSADSIRTLRLKLPAAVADQLLTFANRPESEFLNSFPGIAIVGADKGNAAVLGFSVNNFPRIRLYYQTTSAQTFDFLSVLNPNANISTRRFNRITADRTGTVVAELSSQYSSLSSTTTNGETYVQGGAGLMTRIEFPELTSTGQLSNVAVNRAELVVSPLPGSIISSSSLLILYGATGDGKLLRFTNGLAPEYIPSSITILSPAPALAAYANNRFTFDVTRYVADVLLKRRSNNGLYLSLPSVFNQIQAVSAATSLEESVNTISLGGHNHPTAPAKLRIYYTPMPAN